MEVAFLHIADYVNSTAEQKLNIMGIFNNIEAASLPIIHPEMYLVTQLTANASEYGRVFKLTIKLLNEDATEELINFVADLNVPKGEKGLPIRMNFNLRFVNTIFNSAGTHEFVVLI